MKTFDLTVTRGDDETEIHRRFHAADEESAVAMAEEIGFAVVDITECGLVTAKEPIDDPDDTGKPDPDAAKDPEPGADAGAAKDPEPGTDAGAAKDPEPAKPKPAAKPKKKASAKKDT